MNRITEKQREKIFRKNIRKRLLEVFIPENQIAEKSVSKSQQHFFGMVDAIQKGELDPDSLSNPEKFKKAANSISHKDVEDFASTKHKGLPNTVDEETKLLTSGNHKLIVEPSAEISPEKCQIIAGFIRYCCKELKIKEPIKVTVVGDREKHSMETLAYFNPNNKETFVYGKTRLLADILRSLAHELVHLCQMLENRLNPDSGKTGSTEENEANSKAGCFMRNFGKMDARIFN